VTAARAGQSLSPLPIDALLSRILASLRTHPSLVLEAAPGAGKTTRVPAALLDLFPGEILVLEPRRIAARLAARRVAAELGEEPGQTVGYQVRLEDVSGARTRLRFVTEGILTRRLLSDPELKGVDAVVLDEFHERHLESDLALALLKRLQQKRSAAQSLRLIVMSATLDAAPIARFLDDCPIFSSQGRLFPLTVAHLPYSPAPLHAQMLQAVERLLGEGHSGHILAFLPGSAEIRRTLREVEPLARRAGLLVLPLHGELTPAEQDRAVAPSIQPKLILATNVAESSITIEGVTAVLDSGLARIASTSPWTGLPTLAITRISKASARQRAGRAGRTGPGHVLRLYPEEDFQLRPEHDTPEIARGELAQMCLALRGMGIPHAADLDWLEPPPAPALATAEALLDRLGATGSMAQRLTRFPLPPRLARVLVEALDRGVGEAGCAAVALLASGAHSPKTDLLEALDAEPDPRTLQLLQQLRRLARVVSKGPAKSHDGALLLSLLTGFPDRVARLRSGNQVLLAQGGSAELAGSVPPYEFLLTLEIEDRTEKPFPLIRLTARTEPEWLLDLFPDRIRERSTLTWNRVAERVEAVSALLYDDLLLQESRDAAPPPAEAAALLVQKALEAGMERFVDPAELENLKARLAFAGLPAPDIPAALGELTLGLRSFAELRAAAQSLIPNLEQIAGAQRVRDLAPASVRLPNGRQTRVHYESGKPPWIASRLQDFFGLRDTPRIGPDRTPVVVHLLGPNHRPVQMTSDLAGFWDRLYPQVRRELMRRYPRHQWPEKP
jgi:ATP-dependent helicase HrpB